VHSCWCIGFNVPSAFDPKLKMIQIAFKKDLQKGFEIKEKK
jgi:hypothetical protein